MLSLTTDSAKSIGLGAVIAIVVIGVLATVIVQKVVGRIISLALTLVIALALYNQRASINDCVKKLKTAGDVVSGRVQDPTCKFFGFTVKVPLDKLTPTKS